MRSAINIAVTCAKRKRVPAKAELRLRNVSGGNIAERSHKWIERIHAASGSAVSALDLYAGDHWAVAKSMVNIAAHSGIPVDLWVCSAGYGLLHSDAIVHSYQATFARNDPDSITHGLPNISPRLAAQEWWRLLTSRKQTKNSTPHTIEELAKHFPGRQLWIVASPDYLQAIEPDVLAAVKALKAAEVVIFSACASANPEIKARCLPCNAKLQGAVGGARTSLNVRIARRMLEQVPAGKILDYAGMKKEIERLGKLHASKPQLARQPMTDRQVEAFIRKELQKNANSSYGPLLRKFRGQRCACEYSRFRSLFLRIKKESGYGD